MRKSGLPSLTPIVEAIHPLAQGRKAWLQVARGEVTLGEEMLKAGDAAAITDQTQVDGALSNEPSGSAAVRSGLNYFVRGDDA